LQSQHIAPNNLETRLQKCLFFVSVVTGQNIQVTQLPDTISVKAGENLTLRCRLTGGNLPGGVRWYKGLDRSQPPIYSDKEGASNRVVRVIPGSSTDFSINIQNVQPEDAGTYYCVKFRAGIQERELASGKGTLVSVIDGKTIVIIAVMVCALLVVLVIAVIYLIQARHSKGKHLCSVPFDTDPNNMAYADLNFDKVAQKRPCPGVESPLQSEYATLQAVQPLPNEDNVTYADLDMVQLNKAPKRPSPKAEEASSEYASVQVQNK
uniref:Ig-like domain-containing protein n=1 Tax=Pseudonaja textilis TaxID=8673 RepID=A0A670Z4E8_PSETE